MTRGLLRFGIVLMLIALLLPYALPLIGLADPDFKDVVTFFSKWFPFGSKLKTVGLMLLDKSFGKYDLLSAVQWFWEETTSSWESIMELSRLFYIGVLLSSAKAFFKKLLGLGGKGLWNHLADFILLNIALVPLTILSSKVFEFYKWVVDFIPISSPESAHKFIAALCFFGSLFSALCRKHPILTLLECVWKCISSILIYMVCCCIAFSTLPLRETVLSCGGLALFLFAADRLFSAAKDGVSS